MRITLSEEQLNYICDNIEDNALKTHLINELNKNLKIEKKNRRNALEINRKHNIYKKQYIFFNTLHKIYEADKKITMYAIQKESDLSINTVRKYYYLCKKIYEYVEYAFEKEIKSFMKEHGYIEKPDEKTCGLILVEVLFREECRIECEEYIKEENIFLKKMLGHGYHSWELIIGKNGNGLMLELFLVNIDIYKDELGLE
ncbi:hypothetical protein CRV00_12010 [Malaciobacter molluscorum]|uniref:hypothetical protein n=1 Tax=Malaciobacter molluscorum TaxID=1032072 RepID=UPI00100AED83|nr:hypothetical protein [Malaciobacter molluscorum]RXJ92865.1 hypothetical protein CRV00_12010 [Malaciobacter molluscorum]